MTEPLRYTLYQVSYGGGVQTEKVQVTGLIILTIATVDTAIKLFRQFRQFCFFAFLQRVSHVNMVNMRLKLKPLNPAHSEDGGKTAGLALCRGTKPAQQHLESTLMNTRLPVCANL